MDKTGYSLNPVTWQISEASKIIVSFSANQDIIFHMKFRMRIWPDSAPTDCSHFHGL